MALILFIETSTTVCSVALARDGKLLSLREVNEGYSHAENITVFIEEVCKEAGITFRDMDAVAVSRGPGSYTGLRIGASTAKGLCYALEKPLIAVETLRSLAACRLLQSGAFDANEQFLVPMIDARRMEVYCAVYDTGFREVSGVQSLVVNEHSFKGLLNEGRTVFFGDGSAKCKSVLGSHPNAGFEEIQISATGMIELAEEMFFKKEFASVSLFEPFYLKEAAIGTPRT